MTNISELFYQDVGNIYGERTWIEYGFRHCKSELGWSDFHLTVGVCIAKWWEVISCAFLLVSLQAIPQDSSEQVSLSTCQLEFKNYLAEHPYWEHHLSLEINAQQYAATITSIISFQLSETLVSQFLPIPY